tara:strand:+ start:577 stop:1542 length:966 start_codon:yes stop_codon:yes gene_type:complete
MNGLYPAIAGNIRSIDPSDPDCSGNLYDYYIKTAYNSCSGGSYKNNFVDVCNLKSILKEGVRGLDFEIYSIDNQPVVATSTSDSYYVKETFNSVSFSDVMSTIANYAFSSGTAPNFNDPIIIHLRIMSTNQEMYNNLANIFASYSRIMLGKEYSYENSNTNIGNVPITQLMNKCILIVDKINNAFIQNDALMEYVNLASNSVFMRTYNYIDVQNNPDVNELTNFNKRGMTIVFPNNEVNPINPSGMLCREYGCQMVAMRYQYVDNFLEQNALFFDRCTYAFCLKPARLRYVPVVIDDPIAQNPDYSYATRNVTTDYYDFDF